MRVLIADDDPIIRLDLKQMLETLGYQVAAEADNGRQAVESAREANPDVCILDVKMPVQDGIDAATEIAEAGIAPAILLTAYFAYLVKPFKPSDLPPAIEVARSRFEQNRDLSKELESVTERLEARKAIDRAKGIVMEQFGVNEAEAYRRIQQQSMNARKSMREVAEAIILAKSV
jgi:two-component system, response regulator PdtaR